MGERGVEREEITRKVNLIKYLLMCVVLSD